MDSLENLETSRHARNSFFPGDSERTTWIKFEGYVNFVNEIEVEPLTSQVSSLKLIHCKLGAVLTTRFKVVVCIN